MKASLRRLIAPAMIIVGSALMMIATPLQWVTWIGFLGFADVSGLRLGVGIPILAIGLFGLVASIQYVRGSKVLLMAAEPGFVAAVIITLAYAVLAALAVLGSEYGDFAGFEAGLPLALVGAAIAAAAGLSALRSPLPMKRTESSSYRALVAAISAALFECDPAGVNHGVNTDEYDAEAGHIVPRLQRARSVGDVRRIVVDIVGYIGSEGPNPEERYECAAERIWDAWQAADPEQKDQRPEP